MDQNLLRDLPSVHDILETPLLKQLASSHDHEFVVDAVRREVADVRMRLARGEALNGAASADQFAERVQRRLLWDLRPKLRRVINATGIILHTNLGRAPIAEAAAGAAHEAAHRYLNLELDLDSGKRSSRQNAVREWICRLTGAESATAVNNNAAATVIALRALCRGREVIISRGQLIEIGGSFRIPEIMAVSGAILREVGTTNITRLTDYETAIGPHTAALMRIHTSNYRISGFTEAVSLAELVALGKKHHLKVIDDIGSGALFDFARFGFDGEPIARASVAAGADLVLFSGDKLMGGPQAGILAGQGECIAKIEKDPLMRAFRLDKMTLAALEATLRIYLSADKALQDIPVLRMLSVPPKQVELRSHAGGAGQGDRPTSGCLQRLALRRRGVCGRRLIARSKDADLGGRGAGPKLWRYGVRQALAHRRSRGNGPPARRDAGYRHADRFSWRGCGIGCGLCAFLGGGGGGGGVFSVVPQKRDLGFPLSHDRGEETFRVQRFFKRPFSFNDVTAFFLPQNHRKQREDVKTRGALPILSMAPSAREFPWRHFISCHHDWRWVSVTAIFCPRFFPGWAGSAAPGRIWPKLLTAAAGYPGVYVVFREDLADEHDPEESLARDFGAEPGDDIIEVHIANLAVHRRKMGALVLELARFRQFRLALFSLTIT